MHRETKAAERRREKQSLRGQSRALDAFTRHLLELFSRKETRREYLDAVVEAIRQWSACRCVGIRVTDPQRNIPYESFVGFSREFWELENRLSLDRDACLCVRAILQAPDQQDLAVMTPGGSFHLEHAGQFAAELPADLLVRYRGTCMQSGFNTVAVIPIFYRSQPLGALHLADEREEAVPRASVEFLESMAPLIGEAIHRFTVEQELRSASSYARSLIEASLDPQLTVNSEGKIADVNKAMEEVTGVARESLIGSDYWIYFTEPEKAREGYQAVVSQGFVRDFPIAFRHVSGRTTDVVFNATVYRNEAGEVQGVFAAARDITERKRMEAETRARAAQQVVVARLGRRALAGADLDELFQEATSAVAETLGVPYCKVLELLPGGKALLLRAGVGWKEGLVGKATVGAGTDSQAGYTLLSDGPVIVDDLRTEKRFSGPPLLHEHAVTSGMSVIIRGTDVPFGVLGAHATERRAFTASDVDFLISVANVLASVIERRRMDAELRAASLYARSLLEASLDPLVTISAEGKITDVNRATETATGVGRAELIGSDFSSYFTEPEEASAGYRKVLAEGSVTDYPLTIRHTSGRLTDVLYNATVYRNEAGEVQGVFAAARDITERKRAEEELARYREHLEELVAQRTRDLEAANRQLEAEIAERKRAAETLARTADDLARSNKELEQFAYVASHDLQEPLRVVTGYVQLLERRYRGKFDSDAEQFIHYVVDGVARMQQLITDLLAYSRVGTQGKAMEPIDPASALARVLVNLGKSIAESGAVVTHEPLPTVRADETQFVQLLQNLIANAIKFRSQRRPEIHVSALPERSGFHFSVRDNGIGIEKQYWDQVFVIFQRLHTRQKYPGTGIGLAICKRIVERHGGRIWLESEPGQGTTFHFTIHEGLHHGD